MTIPKHNEIRFAALTLLSQHASLRLKDFEHPLAEHFQLTADELSQEYGSGNGRVFYDRISWALSYMNMAHVVEKPQRGVYQINDLGKEYLQKSAAELNDFIARSDKIVKRRKSGKQTRTPALEPEDQAPSEATPQESLSEAFSNLRAAIYQDILQTILSKSPRAFEKLVVELLQRMGYGGQIKESGTVTSYSNDKGIDGIVKEDVLGLGRIHIQAKRYAPEQAIGREDIQKFVGALAVAQSNKGVFITTSYYSKGALEYAASLNGNTTVVLIDGQQLAEYIYDYGLGMQVEHTLEIKKLDGDFWDLMED